MPGRIDAKLAELRITLPTPPAPVATYVPYVVTGNLVVVSGQIPFVEGKLAHTGRLSNALDIEPGQAAARVCLLNVLAQLRDACADDLDRVRRVVRLGGFIAADPAFTQHAQVMNGASDLAVAIFGDAGRHARATVGVASLPGDASVEVEGLFEID